MSTFDNAVSIHPYFKVREGQLEACKSFLHSLTKRSRAKRSVCSTISPSKAM
jgi:hypothetical protein